MSEIRVNQIQANEDSVSFIGITTFSGTGALGLPGGGSLKRPEVPKEGQVRYINGDVKKGLEYYNGTEWVTVGVANGSVAEGTTPIGVFGGGGAPSFATLINVMQYITISSEGNATDFGDLTVTRGIHSTCSSSTRGIFAGGQTPTAVNTIDYITIATTGNATDFGDLTQAKYNLGACSSSTRGIFGGGGFPVLFNTIDYITIATTGNATDFGDLSTVKRGHGACSSSTRGIFAGGITPATLNVIEYVTIANTGNTTDFGDLTLGRFYLNSGCSSSTRGIFVGGNIDGAPQFSNIIDYITIATTGNATDFGDLTLARRFVSSCSSSTRGVFGGGDYPTTISTNIIEYITIATTGNTTDFGDLINPTTYLAACSNSHGGLLTS